MMIICDILKVASNTNLTRPEFGILTILRLSPIVLRPKLALALNLTLYLDYKCTFSPPKYVDNGTGFVALQVGALIK
jgi:hypothetical protein